MPMTPAITPLLYDPTLEQQEEDENKTAQELTQALLKISATTTRNGCPFLRSVHAKSHGLMLGEMQVLDNLPSIYAQGIFAQPHTYQVAMRLSTSPGDLLPDDVSTPRGMAIKVLGVEGERLEGSGSDTTQDFLLVNGPAFLAPSAKDFLKNLKLLAATTDRILWVKRALSFVLRGVGSLLASVGIKSGKIMSLGGHPETHILGETFYSQVPFLYGPYVAKLSVAPVSPDLERLTDAPLKVGGRRRTLREAVVEFFASRDAEWEVRVQLCTDIQRMPIEDATVAWPEDESPYFPVARLRVSSQPAWTSERSVAIDDSMAFSPWHGIAAHRPLGSIMRVRKGTYQASAHFRRQNAGVSEAEPSSLDHIPR